MKGTIKSLTDRGFGFLAVEGQSKDIFFHSKSLVDVVFEDLKVGDVLMFDIEQGDKGPAAVNVKRA